MAAMLPVLAIFWLALFPAENIWPHLISTSLPRYLVNTLVLLPVLLSFNRGSLGVQPAGPRGDLIERVLGVCALL